MNKALHAYVESFFNSSELNRLPEEYRSGRIFEQPLIGVSRGNDHIFQRFKEVVGPKHLTPAEAWVQSNLLYGEDLAARLRVVSIVFPYTNQVRRAGEAGADGGMPPEIYCVARNLAGPFMSSMQKGMEQLFQGQGFQATSVTHSEMYEVLTEHEPYHMYSTWSERHVAFAAGLGTFSLHDALITEAGCNIRLASVITDAPLEQTPRISDEPYANCLHFARGICGECIAKCPAGAITEQGHDKQKCSWHGRKVREEMHKRPLKLLLASSQLRINGEIRIRYPVGCALCQFGVPCMDRNPMTFQE
jgi:ferredoxin